MQPATATAAKRIDAESGIIQCFAAGPTVLRRMAMAHGEKSYTAANHLGQHHFQQSIYHLGIEGPLLSSSSLASMT